ncbi:MAG: pyruvate dehydrogenase complex dihydrolipoamide acetyltransferase [Rhodospirillaceae bacterium]|nr:pyruvate dehydrogenase complex dihydrolipoamide acetyltransferase [Rhodospirillaceae bacterium]MDD9916104.1 pyruvate dehydrogenase complex dihydrolipoamide acetyltransferase [Rhodospirillaceae bacterium]MDD9927309.1 pyruvate dehydrogenase complex dihydrolipoamide acetyltransferase [Rhodospirillaceae bacterium]
MPIQILMPALSPTMTEGTLAKWLVNEGDDVNAGDVIAEIETDKATMEVEAVEEGKVGKIVVQEGTEGVAVNALIALLLEDGEDAGALEGAADAAPAAAAPAAPAPEAPAAPAPEAPAPAPAPAAPAASSGDRIFASPLARRMAQQAGLDIATVTGSGPNGRIVKRDIEAALAAGVPAAAAPEPAAAPAAAPAPMPEGVEPAFDFEPANNMRKVIAQRLTESKQTVPHFYLTVDCEIDTLLALRKDLNARSDDYKISVNDLIIKACGVALRRVPAANASWTGDGIKRYHTADISVAVAIDGGLITPVIRDAGGKGLEAISSEMKDLALRAREGKLMPEEYQGGTFSISNLGMFGIKQFDAVINPPQGAIMAVGAGEQRPVVRNGALAVATVMSVTLSVDHRVVDGAVGAELLAAFKKLIEDPMTMLL